MPNRPIQNPIPHFVPPGDLLALVRVGLGWDLADTARKAGVSLAELQALETDRRVWFGAIGAEQAFTAAGVTFSAFSGASGSIFKAQLPGGCEVHVTQRGARKVKT